MSNNKLLASISTARLNAILGVVLMGVVLISVVFIGRFFSRRVDVTEDKLYTLSPASRELVREIEKPVTVRFYYTRGVRDLPGFYKNYATRVEDLLHEYRLAGRGKIRIETFNPTPDSDDADAAELDGMQPRMVASGDQFYLGVAVSQAERAETLPFLPPEKENLLEYELTRAIYRVSNPDKAVVGILAGMPVMGQPQQNPMMMQRDDRAGQPWFFVSALRQDYEVREIQPAAEAIDDDIDVLLIVHPKNLTDKTLYAIDQFVLGGGKVIAFVDPFSAVDQKTNPMNNPMMGQQPSVSTLGRLFDAWGVGFDETQVVADRTYTFPARGQQPDLAVLALSEDAMNPDDVTVADLNLMVWLYSGAFTGGAPGLEKTVLVHSSERSQLVDSSLVNIPGAVARDFSSDMKEYALAVRLQGRFPAAFPDGPPSAPTPDGEDAEAPAAGLTEAAAEGLVILVGDADMLYHDIWAAPQQDVFTGRTFYTVRFDNNNFLLNTMDQITGDQRLISIRSRTVTARPFKLINELKAEAEEKYQAELNKVSEDLQKIRQRLRELQQVKTEEGRQQIIETPETVAEREKARERLAELEEKEDELRKQLRSEIDAVEAKAQWLNIALMPLLVIVVGLGVAIYRKMH